MHLSHARDIGKQRLGLLSIDGYWPDVVLRGLSMLPIDGSFWLRHLYLVRWLQLIVKVLLCQLRYHSEQ